MTIVIKDSARYLLPPVTLLLALLAIGCTSKRPQTPVKPAVEVSLPTPQIQTSRPAVAPKSAQQEQVAICRQALDSLQRVNPRHARKLKSDFNALVNAASQYNAVRAQVGDITRQAVDAMYNFKTTKLCADIDKELMDSLITRGENSVR